MKVLIVGAGGIAPEYVKALRAIGINEIDVLSRSVDSSQRLASSLGLSTYFGGGQETLGVIAGNYNAIVLAASIEALLDLMCICAEAAPNVPVLVEKPAALSSTELSRFVAQIPNNRISVALNRLYFPSVAALREELRSKPPTSAHFSFTEWVHRIDPAAYSRRELERWGLSNCIHVIGTVFDLIGLPRSIAPFTGGEGEIGWHASGSIFAGAGVSHAGVPFSYLSDWTSAGRWSISVGTADGRYDLMPMEGIIFTPRGSVQSEVFQPVYSGDTKCGFVEMLGQWLRPGSQTRARRTVGLDEMIAYLRSTETIFGYGNEV